MMLVLRATPFEDRNALVISRDANMDELALFLPKLANICGKDLFITIVGDEKDERDQELLKLLNERITTGNKIGIRETADIAIRGHWAFQRKVMYICSREDELVGIDVSRGDIKIVTLSNVIAALRAANAAVPPLIEEFRAAFEELRQAL